MGVTASGCEDQGLYGFGGSRHYRGAL